MYGEQDASAECSLPNSTAASINGRLKDAQERCLSEARAGLAD
jgi:hypothetical protein